jgi:hypothetical protein
MTTYSFATLFAINIFYSSHIKIHTIMTTTKLQQVKQALQDKGCSIAEENGLFGFRLPKQHVYHWFDVTPDGSLLLFNHSYSQNTGRSKKGMYHRFRVYRTVRRITGIDI